MESTPFDPPGRPPLGQHLREARQQQGHTVREVALRAGVSPSLISQIERDKVTPSVSTLSSLVTVLGLQMGDLFSGTAKARIDPPAAIAPGGPVTAPGARPIIDLEAGICWERLTATPDPLVEFLVLRYPPGASSEVDPLVRHGGKEYGYVISGTLGVTIGFDEYALTPGMAISFDSSAPHRLWAVGDQAAEALWVVVGRHAQATPTP